MSGVTDIAEAPARVEMEDTARALVDNFLDLLRARKGEPGWMRQRREASWEEFARLPMPKATDEAWRRTDIRSLKLQTFAPDMGRWVPKEKLEAKPRGVTLPVPGKPDSHNAVVHAGGSALYSHMSEELARQGIVLTDLDTAARERPDLVEKYFMRGRVPEGAVKFSALHGAFCTGGTFLYVPPGVVVDVPLQSVLHFGKGSLVDFSHTLIVAGENSQVTFIEELSSRGGPAEGLHVGGAEIYLEAGSIVRFVHVQDWGPNVWNFAAHRAYLGRDSQLKWVSGLWGGRLSKVFQEVELNERGSMAEMLGVLIARGRQHMDYETFQDHQAPDTTSDLLYKGVLTERARSVWRGMIRVEHGANGTDAYQINNNLLLDRRARADSIPGLEIEANEVRCTHGATAGPVDKDQVFYLQSRGVPEALARRLLVEGFFQPVFQRVGDGAVERRLSKAVDGVLRAQGI